jgi:hypothetical protein
MVATYSVTPPERASTGPLSSSATAAAGGGASGAVGVTLAVAAGNGAGVVIGGTITDGGACGIGVATGGGAILLAESREILNNATVIYLATDGKHIASRLRNGSRPLLKNGIEDWKKIYEARKPIYEEAADITIDTSGQPLAQTVSEITERLGS